VGPREAFVDPWAQEHVSGLEMSLDEDAAEGKVR
jgi:hypothetical protein